jgi:hypothetical protein
MRGTALRMGPKVLRGTGEEGSVNSIRIIMTLLALAFGKLPRPPAAPPLRSPKNLSGDDYPERGEAKTWVIIALVSAALIAVLLAISGPTLALLWSQVLERFG